MAVFLLIELLDEFVYGALEASWPLIRSDLGLTYVQIGLLLSVPRLGADVLELGLGVLGDVWNRRLLVLGGGVAFAVALALAGVSPGFLFLLAALSLLHPASGAFVGLAQASYMDSEPERRENNMARWTLAGEVGVVLGALALMGAVALGWGWRGLLLATAATTVGVLAAAYRAPLAASRDGTDAPPRPSLRQAAVTAWRALRRTAMLRWLVMLQFADFLLDGLHGYVALYFVDVVGTSETYAAAAVVVWTGAGLVGTALMVPLLERVDGLSYLRASAFAALAAFAAFLLLPGAAPKLAVLALLALTVSGWYSVIVARIYSSLPGWSGTVMTLQSATGLVGSLVPLGIGIAARTWGLGPAIWLLASGPVVLLAGLATVRGER